MNVQVLASSSAGNCYRVSGGDSSLLLECGIPLKKIREGLDFGLSRVDGCLLSHSHLDHAKAAADIMLAGVDLYTSKGTAEALGLTGHRLHLVKPLKWYEMGPWRVFPFDTVHDTAGSLGFLVDHANGKRLLFATDSAYLKYLFTGVNVLMLECNYELDALKDNVQEGIVDRQVKRRILHNHMSLATAKGFLQAMNLSQVTQIWLLHVSNDSGDEARFKSEVQSLTGCPVYVAPEGGRS